MSSRRQPYNTPPRPNTNTDQDSYEEDGEIVTLSVVDRLLETFKLYLIRPFLMGLSGAFGVSVGYAVYDYAAKKWWNF